MSAANNNKTNTSCHVFVKSWCNASNSAGHSACKPPLHPSPYTQTCKPQRCCWWRKCNHCRLISTLSGDVAVWKRPRQPRPSDSPSRYQLTIGTSCGRWGVAHFHKARRPAARTESLLIRSTFYCCRCSALANTYTLIQVMRKADVLRDWLLLRTVDLR